MPPRYIHQSTGPLLSGCTHICHLQQCESTTCARSSTSSRAHTPCRRVMPPTITSRATSKFLRHGSTVPLHCKRSQVATPYVRRRISSKPRSSRRRTKCCAARLAQKLSSLATTMRSVSSWVALFPSRHPRARRKHFKAGLKVVRSTLTTLS